MIYGAITNSWREQLPSHTVKELVGEAMERGAKHIELRQTCLGECEEGDGDDWRPNLDELHHHAFGLRKLEHTREDFRSWQ